jgi:hypothetical protein
MIRTKPPPPPPTPYLFWGGTGREPVGCLEAHEAERPALGGKGATSVWNIFCDWMTGYEGTEKKTPPETGGVWCCIVVSHIWRQRRLSSGLE